MIVLAPLVRGRKGQHKDVFAAIRKAGFVRVRVDGEVLDVEHVGELAPRKNHTIEAVVDRIVIREGVDARLAESIRLAVTHGEGAVLVSYSGAGRERRRPMPRTARTPGTSSSSARCTPARTARSASRSSSRARSASTAPTARARRAKGWAARVQFDPELVLPDESLSLADGAIAPWKGATPAETRRHKAATAPSS